jgi:hypothetical protein
MRSRNNKLMCAGRADTLDTPSQLGPGGDLWRYAPVRDAQGNALSDLMMLLPGLQGNGHLSRLMLEQLQDVLDGFGDRILFADLNIRLGILWVSVSAEPGLCADVAQAIRTRIEGARLVCNYTQSAQPQKLTWKKRVKRLLLSYQALRQFRIPFHG